MRKLFIFLQNFFGKVLLVRKIVVPLHPLSLRKQGAGMKKEFFESLT